MSRISGFSGCDLKIVFEEVVIFLSDSEVWRKPYQDVQDFRIKRKIIMLVVEKPIYMGAHFSTHNINIIQALRFVKS